MSHPRAPLRALPLAGAIALAVTVSVVLGGCSEHRGSAPGTGAAREPVAARVAAASLYELTFPLTDAHGRVRYIGDFRGQPFVASMVYTHCTSVCPRITADLQSLDRALPPDVRAHTQFVLFSLDPARDTPAALRAFAREHHLDAARWTLLAAGVDDMRTLAGVLDVRFRPDAGGEIAHSAVIVVVDRAGVIRHRQAGLSGDPAPLVAAVRAVEWPQ
jgi:protein SCO1